jgi:hypothetical protein
MTHPAWLLVPWAVFALAALLKLWRITAAIRRSVTGGSRPLNSRDARAMLERIWHNDSLTTG